MQSIIFPFCLCSCIDFINSCPSVLFNVLVIICTRVKTYCYATQFASYKFLTLFFAYGWGGSLHFVGPAGVWGNKQDHRGAFLIDRSPEYFEPILNYLRHGQLIVNDGINLLGEFSVQFLIFL